MSWELVKKIKPFSQVDGVWLQMPCIRINKNGVTFNNVAIKIFNLDCSHLLVYTDEKAKKIGFKIPADHEIEGGYQFKYHHQRQKKLKASKFVDCKKPSRLFPDCIGKLFEIKTNTVQHMLEVDLNTVVGGGAESI